MNGIKIIDTNSDNILDYGVCGYKNIKREGYPEKINWLKERYKEGMRIKILYSEKDKTQGMIEYIPGEYCWRPVSAAGYMFIHCIFVGFKKDYKGKGYGSLMLNECIKDAEKEKMNGVATIARKGAFMASSELFEKNGFIKVESAPPDFELLVKKFRSSAPNPEFKENLEKNLNLYKKGLSIIRADQCPYTVKNVKDIVKVAEKKYKIKPKVINLKNHKEAQESPCPFGTFCIIYNGKILAHHPISSKRFQNIMEKELK